MSSRPWKPCHPSIFSTHSTYLLPELFFSSSLIFFFDWTCWTCGSLRTCQIINSSCLFFCWTLYCFWRRFRLLVRWNFYSYIFVNPSAIKWANTKKASDWVSSFFFITCFCESSFHPLYDDYSDPSQVFFFLDLSDSSTFYYNLFWQRPLNLFSVVSWSSCAQCLDLRSSSFCSSLTENPWMFCFCFFFWTGADSNCFFRPVNCCGKSSLPISLNLPSFSSFIDSLLIRADPSDSNRFFFSNPGASTREDSFDGDEVVRNFVSTKILDYNKQLDSSEGCRK